MLSKWPIVPGFLEKRKGPSLTVHRTYWRYFFIVLRCQITLTRQTSFYVERVCACVRVCVNHSSVCYPFHFDQNLLTLTYT